MTERFERFTALIAAINRNIRKIKNIEMSEFDLKGLHASCIYYLYVSESGITATELCDKCGEDKATISRSLEHLEKNGFALYSSSASKRYKSPIALTEKGRLAGEKIFGKITDILKELDELMNNEKRDELYKGLEVISDELEKISKRQGEKKE